MSLCRETSDKYLVYRFGSQEKVDIQYPATLDETSWNKFEYEGYARAGGVDNDAMGDYSISFKNNNVEYVISQSWRLINNEYYIGILVSQGVKKFIFPGVKGTQSGSLVLLEGNDKLMNKNALYKTP